MGVITSITEDKVYVQVGDVVTAYDRSQFDFIPKINGKVEMIRDAEGVRFKEIKEKRTNKIVYILLAFFFGLWGIHRFVAGHWIAGICYLITFIIGSLLTWVFGLGFFVLCIEGLVCIYDIIKAACKTSDEYGNIVI